MHDEVTAKARREVAERIEGLGRDQPLLALRDLMHRLRSVRALAHACGLRAVASLGYALEDELVARGREAAVVDYLDRMRDAVDIEAEAAPHFVELALATICARLAFA